MCKVKRLNMNLQNFTNNQMKAHIKLSEITDFNTVLTLFKQFGNYHHL